MNQQCFYHGDCILVNRGEVLDVFGCSFFVARATKCDEWLMKSLVGLSVGRLMRVHAVVMTAL